MNRVKNAFAQKILQAVIVCVPQIHKAHNVYAQRTQQARIVIVYLIILVRTAIVLWIPKVPIASALSIIKVLIAFVP